MASIGLQILTILLGAIFIFLGNVKLTPQFFPEYHERMRHEFGKLNKEFPFYHLTGFRPYAKNYRMVVGAAEMSSGTLLLLGGAFSKSMANVILLVLVTNMIIAFQRLHYSVEYIGGGIVLAFLLLLRLILASKSTQKTKVKTSKSPVEDKND